MLISWPPTCGMRLKIPFEIICFALGLEVVG
jgi:hypothetical protein